MKMKWTGAIHYTDASEDRQERLTLIAERSFPRFRLGQIHAESHSIPPIAFGLIHSRIGNRDQELGIAIGGAQCYSDTYGQRDVVVPKFHAFATDRLTYAFCESLRQAQIATRSDDQKFLAAV